MCTSRRLSGESCSVSHTLWASRRPAHGPPGGPEQYLEDRIFLRRQVDRHAPARHAVAQWIEREIGHAEDNGPGEVGSAEQGVDSRQQLGESEGLHEVIVRPQC